MATAVTQDNRIETLAQIETSFPLELRNRKQWVCWRYETRDGKPTKVPYNVRTGAKAQTTNPLTWSAYERTAQTVRSGQYDGVGYTFNNDETGIDLDHCRDAETGAIEPWAQEEISKLNSYTEISPSGTGFHIYVKGKLPGDRRRAGSIEMYSSGRFFTVTGNHLDGTPQTIEPRQDALNVLYARTFADSSKGADAPVAPSIEPVSAPSELSELMERLRETDPYAATRLRDGYPPDPPGGKTDKSKVDGAVCCALLRVGATKDQLCAIVGASPLNRPDKWGKRADYRERTIKWAREEVAKEPALVLTFAPDPEPVAREEKKRKAFPDPARKEAFRGLAGEFVDACYPHTETSREALLADVLVRFAAYAGWREKTESEIGIETRLHAPHAIVGGTIHPALLHGVLIGDSASGKGDAAAFGERVFDLLPDDLHVRRYSGVASGEVLADLVRDPVIVWKESGEPEIVGKGQDDKRVFVFEPEFSNILTVAGRPGNTLSDMLRKCYDGKAIGTTSKTSPASAKEAHIALMGHITPTELRQKMSSCDLTNGFANRMLWVPVRRMKELPSPDPLTTEKAYALAKQFETAIRKAHKIRFMERDAEATALWNHEYRTHLTKIEGLTLAGKLLQRAKAQCLRLSMAYALLDGSATIRAEHVRAALAFWDYLERGAYCLFGDATGNGVADEIWLALQERETMRRTELSKLFHNHQERGQISAALETLRDAGRVRCELVRNGRGRPSEVWSVV